MDKNLLLFSLFRLSKELHKQSAPDFEALGLYRGQPHLINILREKEGKTMGEIASRVRSEPATLSKMVKRMEQNGFVSRRVDAEDHRITRIYLTEKGRSLGKKIDEVHRRFDVALRAPLTEEEQSTLEQLLTKIFHTLKEEEENREEKKE